MNDWRIAMGELASAEEFLDFFCVAYEPAVVRVNRLHILQRFHDYLAGTAGEVTRERAAEALRRAYEDFVHSDARREKVFNVFRRQEARVAVVPLSALVRTRP